MKIRYLIATILAALSSLVLGAGFVIAKVWDSKVIMSSFGAKFTNTCFFMAGCSAGDEAFLSDYFVVGWFWLIILTYICGGLLTAGKMILDFALKGLVIPPPFSLMAVPLMGLAAIVFILALPIIPVLSAMHTYAQ